MNKNKMRFSLKQLYADLKKITIKKNKNSIRLNKSNHFGRKNRFGNRLDEFIYTGPYIKRSNKRDSGFFTEFQLLTGASIYNTGSVNDLHLSIIDALGYAVAHITYKPDGPWGIAFHYGIKNQDDEFPVFWITRPKKNKGRYDEVAMEAQMEKTYNFVVKFIWVIRRDDYGNEIERYPFHPLGTVGRVETTPQRVAAEEVSRKRSSTPGYVSDSRVRKRLLSDISNITL